ncbi:pyridoxal phosphate-dependent transferase [Hyaloraphidium curvatum]|nr:pyridoxal phosphate-dependent transferase [Hyaloraphidium curvatum]
MTAAEASSLTALAALSEARATTLFSGVTPAGLVNLAVGAPSDDLLPAALVRDAWAAAWDGSGELDADAGKTRAVDFAQYGPQLGHASVLEALSGFLAEEYAKVDPSAKDGAPSSLPPFLPTTAASLALTAGASQSLFNVCALFLDKQSVVLMEDPTYFLAWASIKEVLGGFEAYGVRQRPGRGIDVGELERTLAGLAARPEAKKYDRAKFDPAKDRFPFMLYCNPTYNNPTGGTMPSDSRARVVELAYQYGVLVVCDDVYDLLPYPNVTPAKGADPEPQPPRLLAYDLPTRNSEPRSGRVISNGSFSKLFGPGSRMGWVESSSAIISRLNGSGLLASGGAPQHLLASLLLPLLRTPLLRRHIARAREAYSARLAAVLGSLEKEGLDEYLVSPPRFGGFFLFLRVPGVDTVDLRRRCISKGVSMSPGVWFSPLPDFPGGPEDPGLLGGKVSAECFRIAFTYYKEEDLVEGVRRLGEAVKEALEGK